MDEVRSQWPISIARVLRRGSEAACILKLRVRIPPGIMDAYCDCCVLSGRGFCDWPISRTEESYLMCACVCVCVCVCVIRCNSSIYTYKE